MIASDDVCVHGVHTRERCDKCETAFAAKHLATPRQHDDHDTTDAEMNSPRNKSLSGVASAQRFKEIAERAACSSGCGTMRECVCAYLTDAASAIERLEAERDEIQAQVNGMAENLSAATAERDRALESCAQMKEELMWHRNKPLRAQEEREVNKS